MAAASARPMPGGPLALDLLNTSWITATGGFDWLSSDEAVHQFLAEHGQSSSGANILNTRDSLVSARDLISRLFEEPTASLPADLAVEVGQLLESARVTLVTSDEGAATSITGDQPHNAVSVEALVNAIELRRTRPDRVRSCEHETCVLWFLDTSKGGRRRWCSMERCGNRAKAQRHYNRSKT